MARNSTTAGISHLSNAELAKRDPWHLPPVFFRTEDTWTFNREVRDAGSGCWRRSDDEAIAIRTEASSSFTFSPTFDGVRHTLKFYLNDGTKTDWVIHEYKLVCRSKSHQQRSLFLEDEVVICKVFKKDATHSPSSEITTDRTLFVPISSDADDVWAVNLCKQVRDEQRSLLVSAKGDPTDDVRALNLCKRVHDEVESPLVSAEADPTDDVRALKLCKRVHDELYSPLVSAEAGPKRNDEAPNSAPLGAMGSVLRRLDILTCTDNGGSISELKDYIHSITDKMKKLSEVQDPPLTVTYWMKHARELSYDIEAYFDGLEAQKEYFLNDSDAMEGDNHDDSYPKLEECIGDSDDEQKYPVDDLDAMMADCCIDESDDETKDSVDDDSAGSIQDSICSSDYKISGFKTRAMGMIDRYKWFLDSVFSCPTAVTTIVSPHPSTLTTIVTSRPSRDVVLVGNQIVKLISLLQQRDENSNQLKVVSILGDEGIGKSTLIQEIWRESFEDKKIWPEPQSEIKIKRAFLWMGKKPDVRMILRSILSQVSQQEPNNKDSGVTNLIADIRKHLEQKRYFIIVDDVRSLPVWDVVGRAFPNGSFGSRIITTTSDKEVALACCSYELQHNCIMEPLSVGDCKELFIRTVGLGTVDLQLSKEVLDEIKRKCGGLPLAIIWTSILVASKLETEQGLSRSQKEQNLDSDVKKFLNENLRTGLTPVEILNQVLKLCYCILPHCLKTCLLYLSLYPENYFFLKEDLVKVWIAEGFICTSEKDKIDAAGKYFDALVSFGLIQRIDINCNKQYTQGEVVKDEGEALRVPYVVHPTVFDFITRKSTEDNFITIIDCSQSKIELKDKICRLSLHFGSATYATTPASCGLSQVRTLSFMGLLGCMPSLLEFKIVRVMILDTWADDKDSVFSLTEICKLLLLKYLKVSCNVAVELPGKMGCLKLLETLDIKARITAVPSDISNLSRLSYVRLDGRTYPTMHLLPPNFTAENMPHDVEHSSSHMASQITEVDFDPTSIEPVEDEVLVITGTGDYYATEEPINLDRMPVKHTNEHADWRMSQVSDVTQADSPPQEKSGITATTTAATTGAGAGASAGAAAATSKTSSTCHAQSSNRQAAMARLSQETKPVPSSPKIKRQASAKSGSVASTKPPAGVSTPKPGGSPKKGEVKPAADPVQTPATSADSPKSKPSTPPLPEAEGVDKMAIDEVSGDAAECAEELDPELEETLMEETIRMTRAKLRRRTAPEDPTGN